MPLRLIVLPLAGGNRYSSNWLKKCLPDHVEFLPIELPGRGERMDDPLPETSAAFVEDVLEQMRPFLDTPYAIFGNCMGALLSFLVARRITDEGLTLPVHMFVCGSRCPARTKVDILTGLTEEDVRKTLEDFGTPEPLLNNRSFLEMMKPVILSDLHFVGGYDYEDHAPLDIPITAILGKKELHPVSREEGSYWQSETSHPLCIFELEDRIKDSQLEISEIFKSKL